MRQRAAAAGLSLAAALLLAPACEVQGQGQHAGDALHLELQLRAAAGREARSCRRGQPAAFVLVLHNPTDAPQRLTFASAKTHDVAVSAADGREVWRLSDGLFYAQMLTQLELPPHGSLELPAEWQVPPDLATGEYRARATLPAQGSPLESEALRFTLE